MDGSKLAIVGLVVIVVLVGGVYALSGGDSTEEPVKPAEQVDESLNPSLTVAWNEEKSVAEVSVTRSSGVDQIEARGDVSGQHSLEPTSGASMEIGCSDLTQSEGEIDVVARKDDRINVIESIEYQC